MSAVEALQSCKTFGVNTQCLRNAAGSSYTSISSTGRLTDCSWGVRNGVVDPTPTSTVVGFRARTSMFTARKFHRR